MSSSYQLEADFDQEASTDVSLAGGQDNEWSRYHLSPLQEGMLIHSLTEQGVGMYVSQGVHHFSGIDVDAMERAWQQVVQRHEVLRTSFVWEGLERPLQVVHPHVDVAFERIDIQDVPSWEQKIRIRGILAKDRNLGYDLSTAPLFRLKLIQCSANSYYLVFSHHHLLLDGWSNPIILEEASKIYRSILDGSQPSLQKPRPFRHYIEWLESQPLEDEKTFSHEFVNGLEGATPLPFDLGADRQTGYALKSGELPLEIRGADFEKLKTAARRCHVTLNTMIQGAWTLLLSRYSERDEIVFGSLVSGRSAALEGIEGMVGMFLNTLPMMVHVDHSAPLRDWLKYIQSQQNILHDHEFSPLTHVRRWSEVSDGRPLFESVIDTNNTHSPSDGGDSEPSDDAVMAPINQSTPILIFAKPASTRLMLNLIYSERRFTRACMNQVGEQFVTLLKSMTEDPEMLVREVSMISEEESQRTLIDWNQTETDWPREKSLNQLFERYAEETPDALAVSCLDETLTYGEMNARANQLARHLKARGIGRGDLVGFCLDRSLEMVITILAMLKTGAGYVPLDPNYPIERLELMLKASGAPLLITQKRLLPHFEGIISQSICLDEESEKWAYLPTENLDLEIDPDDIAYVLYTSGSTGVPKGIVIPHKVPVNRMFIEFDPFEHDESLCAKTSICFVDSVWELWSAWANGLPLTLIPEDNIKDPEKLIQTLADSGSTRIVLVPSLLRAMLDAAPNLPERLPRMRHWICSGEALPSDLSARFVKEMPGAVLTNLYGATEIWDVTRCDTREDLPFQNMPIGKAMGNMRGYVLDDNLQPVPVGVIGEMYYSGVHVAHGYWKRPDLTAKAFLPDPFSGTPGARMYKTGDLGRWLPDGNFEYHGRRDQQVQLRGLRIELGDIESVIREHPDIAQAAVVISDDQRLVTWVVPWEGGTLPSPHELRKYVRQKLPEHMTPAFYLPLERIPLTPNGKTDRRKLPRPDPEEMKKNIEQDKITRLAETPTEKVVAEVWAKYLGLDKVDVEADFFQLGGESIMAVRIITEVGKRCDMAIALSVLMKNKTVADMAAWIDEAVSSGGANAASDKPVLTKIEHGKKAPLSYSQQQMWVLDQLNPGSVSYTVPNVMHFNTPVDPEALDEAISEIVERHEILRSTFASIDGEPFQVIHDPEPVKVPLVDLTDSPHESRQGAAMRLMREQARIPWDLENGPLLRCQLYKIDETAYTLGMTFHHIVTDGRSLAIFSSELQALYGAKLNGRPSPLAPLPVQYADFAIWQRDWMRGNEIAKHLDYWKLKLEDATVLDIPTDNPRTTTRNYRGGQVSVRLDKPVVEGMHKLASGESATTFMALLAAFQATLVRVTGQYDICVGTPTSTRSQPDLERLIGYFVNTVVMRTQVEGDPSFRSLLCDVRDTCVDAYDRQDVPFEWLVDKLGVQRDLSRNPLFQVLFVHQKLADDTGGGGTVSRQAAPEQETANFDVVLNAQEGADWLECKLVYNADIFSETTIKRMGAQLERLLRFAVECPDRPLSEAPVLLPLERKRVLDHFAKYATQPAEERCAHQIIADHAAAHPDKEAVRFDDDMLTYAEFDRRANQVAHLLRERGVGPETVVGWCMERSIDAFVALLGIMKSGGAFLPMDPAHPKERLSYMLSESGADLVVTQDNLVEMLPEEDCDFLLLRDNAELEAQPESAPIFDLDQRNLAYVIFTSGSTGLPKGVAVDHGNLAGLISAQIPDFDVDSERRVLQTLSLSFDAALGEIFRTLLSGATLHLAHKDDLMPGPQLIELLKDQKITNVAISAAALGALPRASDELPDLKTLVVGGDTTAPDLVMHWQKGRRFINGYGPTETTIGSTVAYGWDPETKPPLGRPLPNVDCYVLDRWMQPAPIGTPGELYVGGVGVSRGYLNRPGQTAKVFVPHPFTDEPGARLYRTGDLVRWLPDGQLDFLGRIDRQVKIRGYRIEISEIESALGDHPSVDRVVVLPFDRNGVRSLAGYVTPAKGQTPEVNELRTHLKSSLPDYMVPAYLIICDSFPMTVGGKIDHKALPEPSSSELHTSAPYVEPTTDMEKMIARIWADVLGLEKVGINSNYFELGGDSIMSIRIVARITEAGHQLTLQDIFKHQTVAELAEALSTGTISVNAEQGAVTGDVPLTPVQQWFFGLEDGDPHFFNQWMAIPAQPRLDPEAMAKATRAVAEHHDALRMQYRRKEDGSWIQFNPETVDTVPFSEIDLSTLPGSDTAEKIDAAFERLNRSLHLENGPLFHVCHMHHGDNQGGRLLLTVHHIVMDLVSWTPFVQDLMTGYRQISEGREPKFPMKTTSFKGFADSLVTYANSPEAEDEVAYWTERGGQPPIVADHPDGDHSLSTTDSIFAELDPASTRKLLDVVIPKFETQLSDLVTAVLGVAISGWSGNDKVQIKVEGQGREAISDDLNLSRSIGWFTSFYPIAFEVDGSQPLDSRIATAIKDVESIPSRGISYTALRYLNEDDEIRQQMNAIAEPEIAFNFTGQMAEGDSPAQISQDDETKWGRLAETGKVQLAESDQGNLMEIGGGIMKGKLMFRFNYGRKRLDLETVKRLSDGLIQDLERLVNANGTE